MTTARMSPYLSFLDQAAEAMELYSAVFGGTVTSQTFAEFGMQGDPADADLVMHSQLDVDDGFTLMCADTPAGMRSGAEGKAHHPVCLWGDDEERLRGWWDGLAEGGTVHVPLEKAPWGDHFGQLEDRFGVTWMVNIGPAA
jgi:PhnB protein